jgi:hypothetical protein
MVSDPEEMISLNRTAKLILPLMQQDRRSRHMRQRIGAELELQRLLPDLYSQLAIFWRVLYRITTRFSTTVRVVTDRISPRPATRDQGGCLEKSPWPAVSLVPVLIPVMMPQAFKWSEVFSAVQIR